MDEKRSEKSFLDERVIDAIQDLGERVLAQEEVDKIVGAIKSGTFFLDNRVAEAIKSSSEKILTQDEIDAIVKAVESGNFTIKE